MTSVWRTKESSAAPMEGGSTINALPAWSPSKRVEEKDATPEETTPEDEELAEAHALRNLLESGNRAASGDPGAAGRGHHAGDGGGVVADDDKGAAARGGTGAADSIADVVASSLLDYLSKELGGKKRRRRSSAGEAADIERRARGK